MKPAQRVQNNRSGAGLVDPAARVLFFVMGLGILTACSSGGGGSAPASNGGTPIPPDTNGTPVISGYDMQLQQGDFWEYYWKFSDVSGAQGGSTSTSTDSGSYRVSLGPPSSSGGYEIFPLLVEGKTTDPDGFDFGPRWTHIAIANHQILGSSDGNNFVAIFDAMDGEWEGGGFFTDFGSSAITASSSSINNDFIDTSAHAVGRSQSQSACEYYPGVGTICPDDSSWTIREYEYYKPGMGPVAYSYYLSYSDSGGGFTTWATTERELGLVATNRVASDGFQPTLPPWVQKTPLTTAKTAPFCAVSLNGLVYVTGGVVSSISTDTVDIYDPATDSWSSGVPMPAGKHAHACTSINGKLYVTGGYSGGVKTSSIYEFDPGIQSWTVVTPSLQSDRAAHVTVEMDDALLMIGGVGATSVEFVYPFGASGTGLSMPTQMNYMAGSAVGTGSERRAYVMGGVQYYIYGCNDAKYLDTCRKLNPFTTSWEWTACAALPTARSDLATAVVDDRIYAIGGRNCQGAQSVVEVYDPAANTWTSAAPMLYATQNASAAVVGGRIYTFYSRDGDIRVEEYDPLRDP